MRLKLIRIIYFFSMFLVVLRLGFWQIMSSGELVARAENQRLVSKEETGARGDILFNDESFLATTQPSFLVYEQPKLLDSASEKKDIADKIAKVFYEGYSSNPDEVAREGEIKNLAQRILEKLNQNLYWVSLGREVDIDTKRKLEKMNLKGLGFQQASRRLYPEGSSSAHLLGFVGSDIYGAETGYFGLEGFYNGELKGQKGTETHEKDAQGLPILIGKFISKEPKSGKSLKLNIDRGVQHIIEEKLKKGVEIYGAKGGSVVVMDPSTGAILAMASLPTYDPVNPGLTPSENYKNPVVADGYEPGSTFKVLVMAAAVNEGLVEPDTTCDNCSGPVSISGYSIRTWNNQYQPHLTMMDTIIHSDNTGMVFVGKKLGIDKLFNYIKKFGFGTSTGVDLQDERPLDLRSKDQWKEIDLATASFGQGISVTALQILRAVSAIANGGKLMEPHIVSEIRDGEKLVKINPVVTDQPINEKTARTVTDMMVRAVNEGEAKFAKTKGFKIAGKTGTAQIPVAGHYDANKFIASFVGFAPADNPKFAMIVKYDSPSSSIYGAETAAPTFFDIAKELFLYYGIAPTQ